MSEDEDAEDPYILALDALQAAGLSPPIVGFRAEQTAVGVDIGVFEYRGTLGADERERIQQVMGTLPYLLDEVTTDADGVIRRVEDGGVLGRWIRRKHGG